jgi:hypothetical protein
LRLNSTFGSQSATSVVDRLPQVGCGRVDPEIGPQAIHDLLSVQTVLRLEGEQLHEIGRSPASPGVDRDGLVIHDHLEPPKELHAALLAHGGILSPTALTWLERRAWERRGNGGVPIMWPTRSPLGIASEGATAKDVAGAHAADLKTQDKYGVKYLNYWVDDKAGKVFCLVEAPNADAAHTVHREAHGLVADEIYPVEQG